MAVKTGFSGIPVGVHRKEFISAYVSGYPCCCLKQATLQEMSCWARSLLCYLQKIWLWQKPRALTGTNSMPSSTALLTVVT